MNHCSRCGEENVEGAKFCASCGGRMEEPIAVAPTSVSAPSFPAMRGMAPTSSPLPEQRFAAMRGMIAVAPAPSQPRHAVMRPSSFGADPRTAVSAEPRFAVGKNSLRAIFLSLLFPGGGQFYNGDMKKGLTLVGLAILAWCLTMYAGAWFLGVPLSLGSWAWSFMDAGKVARREKALW